MILNLAEPNKTVLVGNLLENTEKEELIEFLGKNKDVFALSQEDMVGIDSAESVHCLSVKTDHKLVKQKIRRFALEHNKIIAI